MLITVETSESIREMIGEGILHGEVIDVSVHPIDETIKILVEKGAYTYVLEIKVDWIYYERNLFLDMSKKEE